MEENVESLLDALVDGGDLRSSRERFDQVHHDARRRGDANAVVHAALGLGGLWVHEHRTSASAAELTERLRQALALVDPRSVVALRLRLRITAESDYVRGEHAAILALLDEARWTGDPLVRVEALSLAHHCVLGPEHGHLRAELAAKMIAESLRTGRRGHLAMALLWQVVDRFLDADPHAARTLGELREVLAGRDHLAVGYVVNAIEVMLAIRAGRLAEAEEMSVECAERGTRAGDVDALGWHGGQLVTIRWFQGRIAELVPLLDQFVDSTTLSAVDHSFVAARAVAAATAGDERTAAGALALLRQTGLPRSSSWLVTMNGIVEAANVLGDADTATAAYGELLPFARLPMMASLAMTCFGSAHHALGVAAATVGDVDLAASHFREAVQANLALGHWPAVALSRQRLEALTGDQLCSCVREGTRWRVRLGQRSAVVGHSVGMLHLAVLIASPGRECEALSLVDGVRALSGQPLLDRAAVRDYRDRLDTADGAEREWLLASLASATGLGGRARQFSTTDERARIAVGKAIRRAVARVAEVDAVIGEHLRACVHTGRFCAYRP